MILLSICLKLLVTQTNIIRYFEVVNSLNINKFYPIIFPICMHTTSFTLYYYLT